MASQSNVEPALQFNKIVLMLGDTRLKKWKKFSMSEEDRKDQVKVFKKFRESLGNDISFYKAHCIGTSSSRKKKPFMSLTYDSPN